MSTIVPSSLSVRRALLGAAALAAIATGTARAADTAPDGPALMRSLLARLPATGSTSPVPAVTDDGATAPGERIGLRFYLVPRDPAALHRLVRVVQTPGDPAFHRFLSEPAFVAAFAPTPHTIRQVENTLRNMGLTITALSPNHMAISVTTTAAQANALLGLQLHDVERTAPDGTRTRGMASTTAATLPAALSATIRAVGGLDTLPSSAPVHAPAASTTSSTTTPLANEVLSPSLGLKDVAGHLTPADYEQLYDVTSLAARATGQGVTIAIVTGQPIPTADAAAFWTSIGLTVAANHLAPSIVVDGGPGTTTITESAIDVETSGGIAPGAVIQPYVTADDGTGYVDAFEQVASDNTAAIVSLSFDTPETDGLIPLAEGGDPNLPAIQHALHDVLEEMAVQGQTVFVASGDAGAFAVNRNEPSSIYFPVFPTVFGPPAYTPVYSVGAYTADPLVTACGGTVLPFTATTALGFPITVPQEQTWSGSIFPTATLLGGGTPAQIENAFETWFPRGGGGGISTTWHRPAYQDGLPGILPTLPGQSLYALGGTTPTLLATEPAGFPGRNLPDLSANSSPITGYALIENGAYAEGSGTSIVAPQFAGTAALMVQALGHRIGQLNPLLYRLQAAGAAPTRPITAGDDWGFSAHSGYAQTNGLGAMDGEKLFEGLRAFDVVVAGSAAR